MRSSSEDPPGWRSARSSRPRYRALRSTTERKRRSSRSRAAHQHPRNPSERTHEDHWAPDCPKSGHAKLVADRNPLCFVRTNERLLMVGRVGRLTTCGCACSAQVPPLWLTETSRPGRWVWVGRTVDAGLNPDQRRRRHGRERRLARRRCSRICGPQMGGIAPQRLCRQLRWLAPRARRPGYSNSASSPARWQ